MRPDARPPKPGDRARFVHMIDAARKAQSFVASRRRADLDSDEMLSLALTRCIEIIGEAAFQLTPEGKLRCPSVPSEDVIGMRHRIVHAYYNVNLDILWDTIHEDLPPLVTAPDAALAAWRVDQ